MSLSYNQKNIVLAKNLRKNATSQEKHLWYDFLSQYSVRFQRQKTIGDFIVDFYCHKAKLVIEIDGMQHASFVGVQNDMSRTAFLEMQGLKVLRFTNQQIDCDFEDVCACIDRTVKTALQKL